MENLVWLAGVGQLALAAASLAIPSVLGWRSEVAKLRRLTRQVFWTYAGYIWAINLSFGLLSSLAPHWLLESSGLAADTSAFIGAYWLARLILQLVWFDRADLPDGPLAKMGEISLTALFVYLSAVYGGLFATHLGQLG
jgi:hypothetical protein